MRKLIFNLLCKRGLTPFILLFSFATNAGAAVIFSDLFTESADTTLASHTPTNAGASWSALINNGSTLRADASSDDLRLNTGGTNNGILYQANVTGGYQNVDYETSVVQSNGDTGNDYNWMAVRATDANNMYLFKWNETDGQLYKRTGGTFTTLGAATAGIADGSTVVLRIIDTTLTAFDDGVSIRSVTDSDHSTAGVAGLGMGDVLNNNADDVDAQLLDTFSVTTYVRITGTVYSNEGVTNVGAGVNVSVSINGAAVAATDATDASGVYDLRGLTVAAGDVLTVFVNDNTAGNEAAVVTVSDGEDHTGIDLYYNYLKVRQDNGGSLTNTNLDTADNSGDTDITGLYSISGGALTIAAGKELFIDSSNTFAPGNNVTANTIDINGVFTVVGNTVTLGGDWDATGGSFSFTTGTAIFNGGATTQNVTSNGSAFNAVQIGTGSVGAVVSTSDNMDINGALTVLNGGATTFNIANDTVNAASTVTLTNLDTFTVTSSTFIFDGTTTLTSAGLAFNAIQIGTGAVGASLTAADNMDINGAVTVLNGGATTWDVTNRTVNAAGSITLTNLDTFTVTGSTFVFDGTTTLTSAGLAFNTVQIGTGAVGATLTTADNMDINGAVTVLNGGATTWDVANDTINVSNNITLTNLDTFTVTASTFIFDGTTSLTSAGLAFNAIQIGTGAVGASLTAADNMDINGAVTVLNGGATTWNVTSRTINAAGSITLTNLDTFTVTGSTFVFDGTTTLTSAALAFNNVQLGSATAGGTLTTADNMDINGTVTVQNGGATTWDVANDTINVASTVTLTNLDTFTVTSSTFIFDGTTTLTSAGLAFNTIQIGTGAVGASLTTADNMDINGNVTVLNGGATTWDVANDTVNAAGNVDLTNLDTFTVTASTFIFDGTTALTSATRAFNNIQIGTGAVGGSLTTSDNMDINGAVTVLNGGATTWNIANDTINAASTVNLTNLDTFTVTASTFIFDGTTTLTSAGLAFNTVQIGTGAVGASLTTADNMDINGAVTVLNGGATTWDVAGDTINVSNNVTLTNLDTFTVTTSTFVFDGTTSLTSAGLAFNNIQLGSASAGGSLTPADNMDINGNVTALNGGATTWDVTSRTINAAGSVNLTNLDTFTVTGSTFIFDGTTTLTSAGLAFNTVQIGTGAVGATLTTADNMDINGAVTVLNGGATTWDVAGDTINVSNNVTLTNLDTFTVTTSTFVFDGTTSLTSAGLAFNNIQLGSATAGGSLTPADNMDINGNVTALNGGATTWDVTSRTVNAAGSITLTNLDTFTVTGSTFIFDGTTTLTSNALPFNNVQLGTGAVGGSLTTNDNMEVNGNMTILNGGATTWDVAGDTITIATNLDLTNLDTFTVTTSTFVFDGTTSLTSAGKAFNNMQIGTGAVGASLTAADNMDINGAVTVLNGGATTWNVTSRTINAAGSITLTNLDTFTVTGSTFVFDGTTTLTSAGLAFNTVQIGTGAVGATLTTADNMDINGAVSVLNGGATTWDVANDTINVASTLNLTNLDTFTVTSSTFIFDGTTTLTSAGLAFNAIQIGTGAVGASLTAADNMDINGAVTVLNGGATTWNVTSRTINAAGSITLTNLDTFTVTGSTFVFDGTTALTSAGLAFNNVQLGSATAGGSLTPADTTNINGNLTVLNGGATTLNLTSRIMSVAGSMTLTNLDTFTVTGSTVILDGTSSLTVTSAGLSYNNFMINDGLVGYWKLDEANDNDPVIDYSGYARNGTANNFAAGGGPVTTVPATINFDDPRSLDFDGTDDYVQTTSNDLQTLDSFTIALWFRADSTTFAHMILWQGDVAGNGFGSTQEEMSISLGNILGGSNGNRLAFNLGNTDHDLNANVLSVETVFSDTASWHHMAVTVTNMSTAPATELFLDGVSVGTDTGTTAVTGRTTWNTNLRFGRPGAAQRFYDGLLDDVRVYNRVLGLTEIQRLANGNEPQTSPGTYTLQDNLDVNGTLTLNSGELNVGANRAITVAGNWENNGGVFSPQAGLVTLDGTNQQVNSSETFYNLTKTLSASPSRTLTFGQQSTVRIENTLTLQGFGPSDLLNIRSSLSGTRFDFNVTAGDQTARYVDVKDSEVSSNDIRAQNSVNSGNTDSLEASPRWIFGPLRGAVLVID